ncbi:MAG: hypothetical protein K6D97_05340 [Clostridia bacterium]|nr:hypothetical protein [Clostridia bacterium]
MANVNNYRDYFDVDENYFPCIDDSAIEAGAAWNDTYPHETFIELLKNVDVMLSGVSNRSIWIHGAYGTGKSKCAYALKKILEVSEDELTEYWNRYDSLKDNKDLLQRILGHKERKIVTAYRYASGDITSPRDLFFAIQESLKKALIEEKVEYQGENTLKESVISWLEDDTHKKFFDDLLKKPEWSAKFTQETSDEVLNVLKKKSDVKDLMDNIFALADKEGITAMSLDADKLKNWIKDIIQQNGCKIVLVWDEFSGFFKQNKNSLDEFQKIVALCQEAPFYFIVVTHQTDSIIQNEDQSWSVVKQRFNFSRITLPDNIAFELIGHAFNVKPAAKETWDICAGDLNARLDSSRKAVMNSAKIDNQNVIKKVMPIHPMAALVLKNIASAFQSNQRSMFDFIKTNNNEDVHAFQWFISNYGPLDDCPLLTIDMLWDFFYEKGRDNLTSDIRVILDTYRQHQDQLRDNEKRVLKTILIMQAIDKRLGGAIDLLKPTDQNISYAFEGINELDVECKNIAKALTSERKGILVLSPIGNNKEVYGAAVLAGDQAKIDKLKKDIREASSTSKLVTEGDLANVLKLSPALRLRFEETPGTGKILTASTTDFARMLNVLKTRDSHWKCTAVICFAKDEEEAVSIRKMVKEAALNPDYSNIVFIDASSTPIGEDLLDNYVNFSAMASYYQGNNNNSSRENAQKAQRVLSSDWQARIYNGQFTVYSCFDVNGEPMTGGGRVGDYLQEYVTKKYPKIYDFYRGVNENALKLTTVEKTVAKLGIENDTSVSTGSVLNGVEKKLFPSVWASKGEYWTDPENSSYPISEIKRSIESRIEKRFSADGQIEIGELYDLLEEEYGYAPCNLTVFILGFLLKEYSGEPYRFTDSTGSHETMSSTKLSEMIANYVSKYKNNKTPAPTYIVKMTPAEKAFYELTETAWNLPSNSFSAVGQASIAIKHKMQKLGLPVWSLEEVDDRGIYDLVKMYIDLIQKEGSEAHKVAINIGSIALNRQSAAESLAALLTNDNCKKGMMQFLKSYENGIILELAKNIGAEKTVLDDISSLFSVENSSLWEIETGKEQIRRIVYNYTFVKDTNYILSAEAHSLFDAQACWKDKLKFAMCSCEALKTHIPSLSDSFEFLMKIYNSVEILPEQEEKYVKDLDSKKTEIKEYFDDEVTPFSEIYDSYLEGIEKNELINLKKDLIEVFIKTKTDANIIVKNVADAYREKLVRTQLMNLWKEKTSSKNPADWSDKHRTPIMIMVDKQEYDDAKRAFDILNRNMTSESEVKMALAYLKRTSIFEKLRDDNKIDEAFGRFLGRYRTILTDIDKVRDSLERLPVIAYEWNNHPDVWAQIKKLAKAEYDAGGNNKAIERIDHMSEDKLKEYLIDQIRNNMDFGIEILNGGK